VCMCVFIWYVVSFSEVQQSAARPNGLLLV
jgi:hypothetical protein